MDCPDGKTMAYPLSLRHIEEMMRERGVFVDHATVHRWAIKMVPVLAAEPEGRLAAIVDFTFNLGAGRLQASTLRRRVNQRVWAGAAQELRRWVYGGGKVLPGLVLRRVAEASFLLASGQT